MVNNGSGGVSEVEVRAILQPAQAGEIIKHLEERYRLLPAEELTDIYFCPKEYKSFRDIEMHSVGSYSLRLRSKKTEEGSILTDMNVKVITAEGDHNAWDEHEAVISSLKEGKAILEAIGFKSYFTVRKKRRSYQISSAKNMIVIVEDIEDFGPIVEIEILSSPSEVNKSKQEIHNFLASIGIKKDQIVKKSITNLLMNKLASF